MECHNTGSALANDRRSNLLEEHSVLHETTKTADAIEPIGKA